MTNLLIIGSLNIDSVTITESGLPMPGETLAGKSNNKFFGGKGANQAMAAAKLCHKDHVIMLGAVGSDEDGASYLKHMNDAGIDTTHILKRQTQTGLAAVTVDGASGENTVIVVPGANGTIKPSDLDPQIVRKAGVVLCQNEIPLASTFEAVKVAHSSGTQVVWNPAPAPRENCDEIIKFVDILIVNESEAEILSGVQGDVTSAARKLGDKGAQIVIVTLGKRGVAFYEKLKGDSVVHVDAYPAAKVQDTTGAGDCFCGVFSACLSHQLSIQTSIQVANEAAGRSIMEFGAQTSYPSIDDLSIDSQLQVKDTFKMKL